MGTLVEFDHRLREVSRPDERPNARPFLCDGDPTQCKVFLVGLNPGTRTDFWRFWSPETGCDKQGWLKAYLAREKKLKPTRKKIELLFGALAPEIKCLETNLYDVSSRRLAELPASQRSTAVFDFLLKELKPTALLAHGRPVVDFLEAMTKQRLPLGAIHQVTLHGRAVLIYPRFHLSFQLSHDDCIALGLRLKLKVLAARR